MVRRTIAAGGVLVLVILLVLFFRGCLDARKERSIKDYSAQSAELIDQSKLQGESLFELLSEPGDQGQAIDRTNALNGLRVESASLVDRANDLDVPDEVSTAQRYLVDVARAAPRRAGQGGRPSCRARSLTRSAARAPRAIASAMQAFLASDVLLTARYSPSLEAVLKDEDLDDEVAVPRDEALRFVPAPTGSTPPSWPTRSRASARAPARDGEAAPGLHGNGLGTCQPRRRCAHRRGGRDRPARGRPRVRHPGHQPGREHRDRREREGHRRPRGRGRHARGVDRHDRCGRDQDRDDPARPAAAYRPERADQRAASSRSRASRRPTTTRRTSPSSSPGSRRRVRAVAPGRAIP